MALKRAVVFVIFQWSSLLGGSVFGHSLGALGYGMFGQLSWKQKPDSSLDLPGRDGRPLVVMSQTGRFRRNSLKDVVHKGVHDGHGL